MHTEKERERERERERNSLLTTFQQTLNPYTLAVKPSINSQRLFIVSVTHVNAVYLAEALESVRCKLQNSSTIIYNITTITTDVT